MVRVTLAALVIAATMFASTSVVNSADTTPSFAEIDRYVEEQRQARHIPGIALGIVRDGKIVHVRGFGEADASGRPVSPQTPFIIGSLTKSFTAVGIMQLAEAGVLELEDTVQRYLPWFRVADADASERITPRHLLYQTSGLPASAGNAGIVDGDVSDAALERQVRALHSVQLANPVGTTHVYSNANYLILGLIVQTVSGQTYEAYVQDHILTPLDMRRSFTSRGRELPASSANNGALLIYGVLLAAVLTQLVGMLRTIALLRRRGDHLHAQTRGSTWLAWNVGLPLFTNLAWAGLALVLVPSLLAGSLPLLTLQIPDVGYTLVMSGSLALAWAIVRTVLTVFPTRLGNSAGVERERRPRLAHNTGASAS